MFAQRFNIIAVIVAALSFFALIKADDHPCGGNANCRTFVDEQLKNTDNWKSEMNWFGAGVKADAQRIFNNWQTIVNTPPKQDFYKPINQAPVFTPTPFPSPSPSPSFSPSFTPTLGGSIGGGFGGGLNNGFGNNRFGF